MPSGAVDGELIDTCDDATRRVLLRVSRPMERSTMMPLQPDLVEALIFAPGDPQLV